MRTTKQMIAWNAVSSTLRDAKTALEMGEVEMSKALLNQAFGAMVLVRILDHITNEMEDKAMKEYCAIKKQLEGESR